MQDRVGDYQLKIEQLSLSFGGLKAVNDFSMGVHQGEIVGLIGPNGAGKTTVFNCISRFYKPDQGFIKFEGRELTKQPPHRIIDWGIARTFQNVELFKNLSVLDNLLLGQHHLIATNFFQDALALPQKQQAEKLARIKATEIMRLLNLEAVSETRVQVLPFGVQKLVELARALVGRPKLLLLDEPASGSNPQETNKLGVLIKRIRDEFGVSILLVEHDMSLVMDICQRLYVMDFGKKIAEGNPKDIQNNPMVIEAYLGQKEPSGE